MTPEEIAETGEDRLRVRAGAVSLAVGIALLVVKYFAWLWTGSAAILSDALESIANVAGALFALGGLLFARRPADAGHPYGHGKIEYMSAVFEGGLIAFAAIFIVWYAIRDIALGADVDAVDLGLALTIGAGLVNAVLGWWLLRVGERTRSVALVADGRHVLSDFVTSVGVVVGLGLVLTTGITLFDPLAALAVGLNLAWTGIGVVRHGAGGLLDEEDADLMRRLVGAFEASRFPGIIRVHRLRAIRSGRETHADAHLIVPEYWTVEQAHEAVAEFTKRVLAADDVDGDIVFHTDPCERALCPVCDVPDCPVRREPFTGRPPLTVEEARRPEPLAWPRPAP